MKLLLKIILMTLIVGPVAFLAYRYNANKQSIVPYPYVFKDDPFKDIKVDAPILIIGDRLGKRLASFTTYLAENISDQLSKPIKIETLATDGEGLHRTLEKIKSLPKVPLITIYLGGSEEYYEQKFLTKDITKISKNLKLYNDDRLKTLLMIFPSFSKFLYHVVNYTPLGNTIEKDVNNYSEIVFQNRNMIQFQLFEQEIEELFSYLKERNSYLIAITQPLNFEIPPRKNCTGSIDQLTQDRLQEVIGLVKNKDYKSAYAITKDLVLIANSSAKVLFLHGKVAQFLGKQKEALQYLELAMAYDCENWRGNPVYNQILLSTANRNDILIFDFNQMLKDYWGKNILFQDEIFPQNYYYEKTADVLAARIKKLLKL